MEVLDTTIVNVALPQMAGNLGATREEVAWVSTSYILANVVVLPMTAFFTERSAASAISRSRSSCSSSRRCSAARRRPRRSWCSGGCVQGAGGAALLSTAQATLRQIFPREEQGLVQAIFLLGIIVAPTLGPTLGGWITDNASWHWCFFINLPIGIVSAFLVVTFLHDPPKSGAPHGTGGLARASGCSSSASDRCSTCSRKATSKDWFSSPLLVYLSIASAISLVALLWWQLSSRNKHPVIQFRVLQEPRPGGVDLPVRRARLRPLRRRAHLPAVHADAFSASRRPQTGLAMMPGGMTTARDGARLRPPAHGRTADRRSARADPHAGWR